jgi:hypothetical protein
MTTDDAIIDIPADALARVQETHDRKNAEMQALIEDLIEQIKQRDCSSSQVARPIVKRDDYVLLEEASDVTDDMIDECIELYESYFDNDDDIDWEVFFDKLEYKFMLTVIDLECAAVRKIKTAVRNHRAN